MLNVVYEKPRKSNAGAKPIDVVLMFKILVLQQFITFLMTGLNIRLGTDCHS